MPFSISSIRTRTLSSIGTRNLSLSPTLSANKTAATENALLEKYADFNIDAQKLARGERGIVVLSPNGDEPILAKTEWYYTGSGNFENNNIHGKGLAGIATRYQAEQRRLAKMNAEARAVKVEVLFDAESPDEEKEGFFADRSPA